MPHSVFGWSYPPGCAGPPDPPEPPCEVCGLEAGQCDCPVCEICGVQGDFMCYEIHGLEPPPHLELIDGTWRRKAVLPPELL